MEITFFGMYDKAMFTEAIRLTERQTAISRVFRYISLGIAILVIGVTLYTWFTQGITSSSLPQSLRNIITALLLGYYSFSNIFSRRRLLTNLFGSTPKQTIQGNASFEGIALGPNESEKLIKWEQFISKGERGQIFALMTVDGAIAVFHKGFFASESDWQRFRQIANQRVIEPKQ